MAPLSVSVECNTKWRNTEPTGDECFCCGDMMLLWQHDLVVSMRVSNQPLGEHIAASVCGSCKDEHDYQL